jgi:hypothetical protein
MPLGHSIALFIVAILSVYVPSFVGSPLAGAAVLESSPTSNARSAVATVERIML